MAINLLAPSARQSPVLVVDSVSNTATGGSADSINPVITKVGGNPVQVCQEWNSRYALLFPRLSAAAIAALNPVTAGMAAYDTTNNSLSVYNGTNWVTQPLLRTVVANLAQANILAMYENPVQLIAAPGVNNSILISQVILINNFNTAAFTGGGNVAIQYGNTNHAGGTLAISAQIPAAFITAAQKNVVSANGAITNSQAVATTNQGIFITNASGAFADGNAASTVTVNIFYYVVTT